MSAILRLLLLPLLVSPSLIRGAVLPRQDVEDEPDSTDDIQLSPNNKCGPQSGGPTYRCPNSSPCCSPIGYCVGAADTYCLIEASCEKDYSAESSASCRVSSRDTVAPKRTACGVNQNGEQLGICPYEGTTTCCSSS